MDRFKLLLPEDMQPEVNERLTDLLFGNDDLSAFFEDPYLDSILAGTTEEEPPSVTH